MAEPASSRSRHGVATSLLVALLAVIVTGCGGDQSALAPRSEASRSIETLWWWMLGIACVVIGGALLLLLIAWLRRGQAGFPLIGENERVATGMVLVFGIGLPAVALVALFVVSNFDVMEQTQAPDPADTDLRLEVTGNQFWWDVRYPGTDAVTANEIHIPAGASVDVVTRSDDVIHSFWVPQLNRKVDMIPGHPNRLLLRADRPGRYRGQCAELCGAAHSQMGMAVFADPPARFDAWLEHMAAPARAPATAAEQRGQEVFDAQGCASCHTIRGTPAAGEVGPDLTHLQSRETIGALALPNDRAQLASWILDPQHAKPGNRMPEQRLSGGDLDDLLAYLEALE